MESTVTKGVNIDMKFSEDCTSPINLINVALITAAINIAFNLVLTLVLNYLHVKQFLQFYPLVCT